jgi:hypothetical protein
VLCREADAVDEQVGSRAERRLQLGGIVAIGRDEGPGAGVGRVTPGDVDVPAGSE